MSTKLLRDLRHALLFAYMLLALPLLAAAEGQDADAPSARSKSAAEFEDVHAVVLPTKTYGYRDLPGDIAALGDGRLLMVYGARQHRFSHRHNRVATVDRYGPHLGEAVGGRIGPATQERG